MKVFFVNTNKSWGGGEKWHYDIAFALKKKGHDVTIMSDEATELFRRSSASGLHCYPIHITNLSFLNPLKIISVARFLSKEKPDAIVLNFSADVKTAGLAARIAGIRKVIYRRGNAKAVKNSFLNRFLFKHVISGVIANSEETKKSILKYNPQLFPEEKIKVIYNGIDLELYDRQNSEIIIKRKGNQIIIGSAGRLSAEKGHDKLITMATLLKQTSIDFVLLIAGEGPLETALKLQTQKAGLEENIRFVGFMKNIKDFMNSIDVFVLPSLWEGFGYVTIEAMAARRPVLAFNTGSNPEIIINNETGFLINDFDINTMAKCIEKIAYNESLRKELGIAGRLRVEKVFELQQIIGRIEAYLAES